MTTNLEERARELRKRLDEFIDREGEWDTTALADAAICEVLTQVQAEVRKQLAAWMIERSFATGHGDTFEDLLKELSWQVKELRQKARRAALEEAAKLAIAVFDDTVDIAGRMAASAIAKRIRLAAQAAAPATKEGMNESKS